MLVPNGNVQPSRVARYVAGQTWGSPVQSSTMLATGVYAFTTPGHGGIVAVIPAMREHAEHGIHPAALAAARTTGRIETVAVVPNRGGFKLGGPSSHYGDGVLASWAARYGGELAEVWIGEEDCEYATLLLGHAKARAKWNTLVSQPEPTDAATIEYLTGVCQRWTPDFLEHYCPTAEVVA